MLSKAVSSCDTAGDGIQILATLGTRECLRDVHRSFQELRGEVAAGKVPWAVIGGNYHLIVFSHIAALLEEGVAADALLAIANEQEVVRLGTRFWGAYAQGLKCLREKRDFEIPQLKLRSGLEQHWIQYLHLMNHAVRKESCDDCLKRIEHEFAARNRDAKIKDDHYRIEGSVLHPVRWDFRRDAILRTAS
jgi:hypothetical protein